MCASFSRARLRSLTVAHVERALLPAAFDFAFAFDLALGFVVLLPLILVFSCPCLCSPLVLAFAVLLQLPLLFSCSCFWVAQRFQRCGPCPFLMRL
jgi:hypothetical protein